jgi:hypothetical protein
MTLGELVTKSLQSYLTDDFDDIDIIILMENHLFGDPSLRIAEQSQPPQKPYPPQGASNGEIGVNYVYKAKTVDPDGDRLYYLFDWGDDTTSEWLGPYNSGVEINTSHTWTTKGQYQVRVMARDTHGVISEWSDPLPVSMPKVYENPCVWFVEKFFRYILYLFVVNIR